VKSIEELVPTSEHGLEKREESLQAEMPGGGEADQDVS
jgi:hypothetical protein